MSEDRSGGTTILLICREGQSRQVYRDELNLPGVVLVCVETLMQFFRRDVYCPLNGILVDMPTYLRSSEEEKRLLADFIGLFPALRVKCQESSGEIRTLPFGTAYPGNSSPADFVKKFCTSFAQRKIRTVERTQQNMPVLLNMILPVENNSGVRSVTANISCRGCFLLSFEPWIIGERGWLTIPELKDSAPIPVEVCSIRLWGEHRSIPGMGVKFIDLTESQKTELGRLGGRDFMLEDN